MCSRSVLAVLVAAAAGCGGGSGSPPMPTATPTAAAQPSPVIEPRRFARPREAVLKWLNGRRVRIDGRTVRIDPTTLTCAGVGRSSREHGRRVWSRFSCVQPTLPPGRVAGPDAILVVEPTGPRAFTVVDARFTTY
jgi:hypothetical protein